MDFTELYQASCIGCIGTSRPTASEQASCVAIGYALTILGKRINSGNAKGCDFAYANGANFVRPQNVTLYLPEATHESSHWCFGNIIVTEHEPIWSDIARAHHPKYDYMNSYVQKLFDRNAGIVLNSDFIIALPSSKPWGGGTGHGMKIAKSRNIPVLDVSKEAVMTNLLDSLRVAIKDFNYDGKSHT